jgi:hypothetical protein
MGHRLAVAFFVAWAFAAGGARAQDVSHRLPADEAVEAIAQCLSAGNEIVMAPTLACVDRGSGSAIAEKAGMPLQVADPQAVCRDNRDPRILSGSVIKQVAIQSKYRIAPSGIRVVGAVYCDSVDLVGLDVAYSIVLDRSLFLATVNARNLRLRGDFSVDYGALLASLLLNRSRVEGSVYAQNAFIYRFIASDTNIAGSFHLNESLVLRDLQFFRTALSGDLSIAPSAFGSFVLQSSRVGGILELNESEARCGYFIKASDIGYVMAVNAGFGVFKSFGGGPVPAQSAWWRRTLDDAAIKDIFAAPATRGSIDAENQRIATEAKGDSILGCGAATAGHLEGFYFFDNRVQTTFCLRAFQWLGFENGAGPPPSLPTSILALNGSRIASNLIISLWPPKRNDLDQSGEDKQKLEGIGVSAGALILNFEDNPRPYITFIDNLTFDRVHKASLTCAYQSTRTDDRQAVGEVGEVTLPSADEVLQWLDKNRAKSSQPFAAFTNAFERAGASATQLRTRHNTKDLGQRWDNWLSNWSIYLAQRSAKTEGPVRTGEAAAQSDLAAVADDSLLWTIWRPIGAFLWWVIDLVGIAFQFAMWLLADYGLRPGKVVGWVGAVLVLYWLWFRFRLNIVGFEPKAESAGAKPSAAGSSAEAASQKEAAAAARPKIWPLGYMFLFDRLIPAYHIRQEHYSIANFYRAISARELAAATPPHPPDWVEVSKTRVLRPATEAEKERIERSLLVLRILGLVLSVFLLAAINALARG